MSRRAPARSAWWMIAILLGCLLAATLPSLANASVIGIDFGTDWTKVSIVKPGIPLDIVLNAESKRKTPAIVLVRDNDRRYGSDAVSLSTRFPQDSYASLKNLLGKLYDDPIAANYRKTFTNEMVKDPIRGTVAFRFNETVTYSVEELVAMQLAHAKQMAIETGGSVPSETVIAVPPQWGQFERQALLDAAELAGLRGVSLINDETAVAINYAMVRTFETPQYHVFYDVGAGSTVAALVQFSTYTANPKSLYKKGDVTEVDVKAIGYDPTLGGHSLDVKLQQHLAREFTNKMGPKLKGNVFEDSRAMAKLLKEANRVKTILSANTETVSSVEGLMEDLDFKVFVTRATLEDLVGDLRGRFYGPVESVLKQANLTLNDISSIVLVGGGARVPLVQEALIQKVGEDKIAKNVNADEAAVMGAGLQAARLSSAYRIKAMKVKDLNVQPIEVIHEAETKDGSAPRVLKTELYTDKSALGIKKLMNFKRKTDFTFELASGKPSRTILKASVTGLEEAIRAHNTSIGDPKVKAMIELSNSGLARLGEVSASFETQVVDKADQDKGGSLTDKVLKFFKGGKNDGEELGQGAGENATEPAAEETRAESDTESANTTAPAEKTPSTKLVTETVPLRVSIEWQTVKPMTEDYKKKAEIKLAALDAMDAAKRGRESAQNTLEALIYSAKDFFYHDDAEKTSTETERSSFKEHLDALSDWLFEEADSAPTHVLKEKYESLKKLHAPWHFKYTEHRARTEVTNLITKTYNATRAAIDSMMEHNPKLHANAQLANETFHSAVAEIESVWNWFEEKVKEQSKLATHDAPVLLSKEVKQKVKHLETTRETVLKKWARALSYKPFKASSSTSSSATSKPANNTIPSNAAEDKTETPPKPTPEAEPTVTDDNEDTEQNNTAAPPKEEDLPATEGEEPTQTPSAHDEL
ncbi:Hsp70 protein-domain-containing protein [Phlyctochytrium arcticum]|nr:Hsp70 protein-domain-containing protein [Phlyctochytrium arcticum]